MDLMFERMENVGAFQAIPTYDCASKARQCLERNPFLVCADVCLLVKRRPPDPVAPFVIRFFWAPEDEVWIPYALGMASTYAETAIQPML
ncbi:MAG: hypothetical protein D6766_07670 [Verrucomicrobia bacterium]|nr:MAG: hypothetical protein D6766_07670 [Verrucomicrobiota bacterium]